MALGKFGPKAKPAAPALTAALKDDDAYVRVLAATVLYEATGEADAALPVLIQELKNPNGPGRDLAIKGLDRMGAAARAAVPALMEALEGMDSSIRYRAALILYKILGAEAKVAVPVVAEAARSGGDDRLSALQALKKIDPATAAKVRRGQ
jgi:HEAT repeat protein